MKHKKIVITSSSLLFLLIFIFAAYYYLTNYPRLNRYHVAIDAKELPQIKGGLSGLTWNPDTRTLFAVTDDPSSVIEISPEGEVLRTLHADKPADLEAIEYIGNHRFYLSKEKHRELIIVTIDSKTQTLNLSDAEIYRPKMDAGKKNSGLEGLAWKPELSKVVAAQEKKPVRFYNVEHNDGAYKTHKSSLNDLLLSLYIKDISAMDFDTTTSSLYILSDESKKIIQVDEAHQLKFMSLVSGRNGLQRDIPQPEGMATDDSGNLYIVSEPNLFYKFRPR